MDDPVIRKKNNEIVVEEVQIVKKKKFFRDTLVPKLKFIIPIVFVVIILIVTTNNILHKKENVEEKELVFQSDKMQVVLKSNSDTYKLTGSNLLKDNNNAYQFELINTGNININYYDLRIVNQEDQVSTLPYKYLKYSINDSEEAYLSDNNGIIYSGKDLFVDTKKDFNLKIWLDENSLNYYDKSLFLAVEVTLYTEYHDNYVYYVLEDRKLKTSIYEPITGYIPQKEGYTFIGWGEEGSEEPLYYTNGIYKESQGTTLYPIFIEREEVYN